MTVKPSLVSAEPVTDGESKGGLPATGGSLGKLATSAIVTPRLASRQSHANENGPGSAPITCRYGKGTPLPPRVCEQAIRSQ